MQLAWLDDQKGVHTVNTLCGCPRMIGRLTIKKRPHQAGENSGRGAFVWSVDSYLRHEKPRGPPERASKRPRINRPLSSGRDLASQLYETADSFFRKEYGRREFHLKFRSGDPAGHLGISAA